VTLVVRNLATGYGDIRAVWDVSLQVAPGEVTVLLGRNGAGKTTTLRAVAGLNRADGGSITFDGRDITGLPAHRRVGAGIGLVQEGKRIFRRRTVEENLLLGGYTRGLAKRKLRSELEPVYAMFPVLADRRHTAAGQMSGGQQQMLAIGRALMARPRLLLLDEPSMGLAPLLVAEIFRTIGELKASGATILLVEQNAQAALLIADRGYVIESGRIVLQDRATALLDNERVKAAYLGL
jgi:branched-chain amino acid transport system ATP-binding protein